MKTAAIITFLSTLALTTANPTPLDPRTDTPVPYPLTTPGRIFPTGTLATNTFYYANSSVYLGEIKYQTYSEPLLVTGASDSSTIISFQSIHSVPTGSQRLYLWPRQSKPLGFSIPHGSPPQGSRSGAWAFDGQGNLENNRRNLLYACQNEELEAINSWQMWWIAGDWPEGWDCRGPVNFKRGEGCGSV